MAILVSGGLGFIGSNTVVELLKSKEEVVVFYNLNNSTTKILDSIKAISGKDFKFCEVDLLDKMKLKKIFKENHIEAVIHFAGCKYIQEIILNPLKYYENNVYGSCCLFEVMNEYNCHKLVFSSSAAVYGVPMHLPITETDQLSPVTPYGQTKLMIENICHDLYNANNKWSISLLRYFNPIGAHASGLLGDTSTNESNSRISSIFQVVTGKRPNIQIYGNDYLTKDGTCIRDFIHITDLAYGHIAALGKIRNDTGVLTFNLGTGGGHSVLELLRTFEEESKIKISFVFAKRREGDVGECYSNPDKANRILGWKATLNLHDMCLDSWRFMSMLHKSIT